MKDRDSHMYGPLLRSLLPFYPAARLFIIGSLLFFALPFLAIRAVQPLRDLSPDPAATLQRGVCDRNQRPNSVVVDLACVGWTRTAACLVHFTHDITYIFQWVSLTSSIMSFITCSGKSPQHHHVSICCHIRSADSI